MLRSPLVWGAVLLVIALIATVAGDDLSFFPFLLMLVGGWCFGFAFVNATMRMVPARNGVVLHVAGGVVLGAVMVFATEFGGPLMAPLPEAVRGMLFVFQMAAIPATGWIWLGLISRVTDAISRRDAKKRPPLVARDWAREENGDGSGVRFDAVEMRMPQLTLMIIAIVAPVGVLAVLLLIVLDDVVMHLGARFAIIAVGVLLALPAYLLFSATMRRRAVACAVAFGNDEVRVAVGPTTSVIAFRELEHLRWRPRSEYARIEVRGAGVDLSLIAGLAKAPAGVSPELPALPRRVFRRLELAGLAVEKAKRGDVVTFTRAGAHIGQVDHPVD